MSTATKHKLHKPVEWSVTRAAREWNVSRTQVMKWREQGRVAWRWDDVIERRIVILQSERPAPVPYGSIVGRARARSKSPTQYRATG